MSDTPQITLKSKENKQFKISEKAANRAKVIKDILIDYEKGAEIPLEIESDTLEVIIKYLEHYANEEPKEIPKPLTSSDISKVLDPWDFEFISKVSLEKVIDLVNGANYMDIPSLLQLSLCRIGSEMLDKPIEEVRKNFKIDDDMEEDERKEYDKYPLD